MPRETGGGRFGFGDWSDKEFHDRFVSIIGGGGKKNNTYKFAMARLLLDHSCDPCAIHRAYGRLGGGSGEGAAGAGAPGAGAAANQVTYAEMALYFFAYYWPLVCRARLRQGTARQKPRVVQEIEKEFGTGGHPRPLRQAIRDDPARAGRCIRGVARVAFRDVVHRFHKSDGGSDPMFYQYAAGPADRSGNRQIDPGGGILVNDRAARFLRENYGALSRAVAHEWLRATVSFNPGAPDLVGRFCASYDLCGSACRLLPDLEAAGRICFYCGARPGPEERMCIDHVLPFEYVGGAEQWNLVLACLGCSREKGCLLPPRRYAAKLERRNAAGRGAAAGADPPGSMARRGRGVEWNYQNAKSLGYCVAEALPAPRP